MTEPHKVYFDAVLTPNRSLSPRAFLIVMGVVGFVSFIAGLAFLSMGAFPVLGFFGLDALIIWLAFRWSFRAQRQETRIRVTADQIDLEHRLPGKDVKRAQVPTAFAQVRLEYPERRPSELSITHAGQAWILGRFLTGDERQTLEKALSQALSQARSERYSI